MSAPPLDLEALRRAVAQGARFRFRYFWGHRASADGGLSDSAFSQWWPCSFEIEKQRYATAEQFMMASKARLFGDVEILGKIMAEPAPKKCKALGREVRGFDDAAWAAARFDLVTRGNLAKFGQSAPLRAWLLDTGDEILVEASPRDRIWGIGLARSDARARDPRTWNGLNLLGFALVRTRAVLRGETSLEP